ncbi:Deubiquitination-protection protein dph1 [Galdieria sulphuraria]|nr:Deubiquitination-protection protein dph1 [Galdieria sulphuraria]
MSHTASFSVKIKTLDSTEYEVSVTNDTSVLQLKQRLVELTGIPSERQRVIFRGRVLSDDRTLGDYKVEQGNALHLVSRPVSSGTESTSRTADSNVSSNEVPSEGMGIPRGASVFIGSMNIPIGSEEITGVAGSIIQSIQQMMRFAQSRSQFSGQNAQPQNIEQILRNTFHSARQIYQQLQQQVSQTQPDDPTFPQQLPSNTISAYLIILQGLLSSCRLLERFLESMIMNLESQRNTNETDSIRGISSRVTTTLSLFVPLFSQILSGSRAFTNSMQSTQANNVNRENTNEPQPQQQMLQNILQSFAPQITNMMQQMFSSATSGVNAQGFIHIDNLGTPINANTSNQPTSDRSPNIFVSQASAQTNSDTNTTEGTQTDAGFFMNLVNQLLSSFQQSLAASRANPHLVSQGPNNDVGLPSVSSVLRSFISRDQMEEASIMERIIGIVGDQLSFLDLIGLSQGNTSCIRRIRRPVREQLLTQIFPGEGDLSVQIRDVVERIVDNEIGPELERFNNLPNVQERLTETEIRNKMVPIVKKHLENLFHYLLEIDVYSDEEFESTCRSWSYQVAGEMTYTLATMMRNGRSDALESLREYISTRATETFGTQLGAIAAIGSVAIVHFATDAYDQWELQHSSRTIRDDGGPRELNLNAGSGDATQVIAQEQLKAAAAELLAEMEIDSDHATSSQAMNASSSQRDAQMRLVENFRHSLGQSLPSQVVEDLTHRVLRDLDHLKNVKRKPLSKAYRRGYSDSDMHERAADTPKSLSAEDSHKFAKHLLRQAMQEAEVSDEEIEQILARFDQERIGEVYSDELIRSFSSRVWCDSDCQEERFPFVCRQISGMKR